MVIIMNSKKRRERKQMITLAVVAAVVLLLVIVYFIVRNATSDGGEETQPKLPEIGETGTFTIVDENYMNVTSLSYKYNDTELKFHIEDSKWVLDEDTSFPLDQEKLVHMSQAISDFGGYGRYVYDKDRASSYGTDDPMFDISVTYIENGGDSTHTRRFLIGKQNAVSGYYYFYEDGDKSIYTINDAIFQYFRYTKESLFAATAAPSPDAGDVIALTVEYDGGVYAYDAETDGVTDNEDSDSPVIKIMAAMPKSPQLQYGALEAYGADDEKYAEYGLADPAMRVVLKYKEYTSVSTSDGGSSAQMSKEQEFVMLFGDRFTVGEGDDAVEYVYVSEEGSGIVYRVVAEKFDAIHSAASGNEE